MKFNVFKFISILLLSLTMAFGCTKKKAAEDELPSTEAPAPGPYDNVTLSYNGVTDLTEQTTITNLTPSSNISDINLLTNFRSSPDLPAGLVINATTGVISGLTYGIWETGTYTITADKPASSGTVSTDITFGVFESGQTALDPMSSKPVNFRYSTMRATYFVGVPITTNTPSYTAGTITGYSDNFSSPQFSTVGLTVDGTTGEITGTPHTPMARADILIFASTPAGFRVVGISVEVVDGPPTNLTYSTPTPSYPVGYAITTNTPSSTGGNVSSYSVSPALPAGLSLDTTTGEITGTPTTVAAVTNYTVTATNPAGSTTRILPITITNSAPANLTYTTHSARYTVGGAITNNSPTIGAGGAATSYSVNPALPAGITLNTTSGVISGTPSGAVASNTYTVTATNAIGSTTRALTIIVVVPGPHTIYSAQNGEIRAYSVDISNGTPVYVGNTISTSVSSKLVFHPSSDCAFGYDGSSLHSFSIDKVNQGRLTAVNSAGGLSGPLNLEILASGNFIYVINDANPSTQFIAKYSVNAGTCAVTGIGTTSVWDSTIIFYRDLTVAGNNVYVINSAATIKRYTVDGGGDLTLGQTIAMQPHANPPSVNPAVGSGAYIRSNPAGTYVYAFDNLKAIESFSVNAGTGQLTSLGTMVNGSTDFLRAPMVDTTNNYLLSTYRTSSSAGVATIILNGNGSTGTASTIEGSDIAPFYNLPQSVNVFTSESGTYVYTTFSYTGQSGAIRLSMNTGNGALTSFGSGSGLWGALSGY